MAKRSAVAAGTAGSAGGGGTSAGVPIELPTSPISSVTSQADLRSRLFRDFSRFDFAIGTDRGLYVFVAGRWVSADTDWVRAQCMRFVGVHLYGHVTTNLVGCMEGLLRANRAKLAARPPSSLVNTLSGIVDPRPAASNTTANGPIRVIPATAATWLSTVQIPVRWRPDAECPEIDAFLAAVFLPDMIPFIWELWGSFLVPDIFSQHMVWLTGGGGNGKGTFIKLLAGFLGPNAFPMPIRALAGNRFALADVEGKLLIYDADTPMAQIQQSEILKQVSGHDVVRAERKGQPSFLMEPFAKLLFGANSDPTTTDLSQGMLDRWLLVPCERRIRGSAGERADQDAFVAGMLESGAEGALVKAVAGLGRLLARRRFAVPESIAARTATYQAAHVHHLHEFFTERLAAVEGAVLALPELREIYAAWCQANALKPVSNAEILRWMRGAQPGVAVHRADRAANKGAWMLTGLAAV